MNKERLIVGSSVAIMGFLAISSVAWGQAGAGSNNTLYNKLNSSVGTGGPPPRHDLNGAWTAQSLSATKGDPIPPMTPLGQQRFSLNKPESKFGIAGSNDPWKTCDPFGVPRGLVEEIRGVAFAQMPDKMLVLHQYQKIWREVWTDGRALPKNVDNGGPDSRWYGYSVGRWDGDFTFVVDTTGADDRSWIDGAGHPHSVDALVEERYTRVDRNHMEMTVTLNDPKIYSKPFVMGTNRYLYVPSQETEEQFCVPSEALAYIDIIADPAAGSKPH